MEWPQELLNIHSAIQNEPGRRVFKTMLVNLLGPSADEIEVLKEKLIHLQKEIHSVTTKADIGYLTTLTNNQANTDRIVHTLETGIGHLEAKEIAQARDVNLIQEVINRLYLTTNSIQTDILKLENDMKPIKNVHHELLTLRTIMVDADNEIKAKITAIEKRLPPVVHSRSVQTDPDIHDDPAPTDNSFPPDYANILKDPTGHVRSGSFHAWDRLIAK